MKELQPDYNGGQTVMIHNTQRRVSRFKFDPWPSHAHGGYTIFGAASGANPPYRWYLYFRTDLLNGNGYYYFDETPRTSAECYGIINLCSLYKSGKLYGIGEGFNAYLRATLTDKVNQLGIGDWGLAH